MNTPQVKICCISSLREAHVALRCGASALGFVSAMPSGPGPIEEDLIEEIIRQISADVPTFLLTSRQDAESIIAQQRKTKANTLQLVDAVDAKVYSVLRKELPDITIVQVIHVRGEDAITEALTVEPFVDMILLDSGNPNRPVKELGGTGRIHDWRISKKIVESVHVPVFLAGGLNSENIREAIDLVCPYGVDVCSGVRKNNALDSVALETFFKSVHSIRT